MDLKIRRFRKKLVENINACEFPMEVKRLVVKEILEEISETTEAAIRQQLLEENKGGTGNEQIIQQNQLGELSEREDTGE